MKSKSILKTTVAVSLVVLIAKVIGFFRETLIATIFGANIGTDAFFFAQSMPSMIFPAVCSSLSTAFLSLFVIKQEKRGYDEADRYASKMTSGAVFISIGLGLMGVFLAPVVVSLFGPGFSGEGKNLAIHFTKMIMGAFPLNMVQQMLCAILNARGVYIASQVAGVVYNCIIIAITLGFRTYENADVLMVSVIVGLISQVVCLSIFLRKKFKYCICRKIFDCEFIDLIHMTLPILVGNCAIQINTIIDQMLGSLLPQGSLSCLTYATTLIAFVTGIIVTSLSTVLYPMLSKSVAYCDKKRFTELIVENLYALSYVLIPIAVITVVCSEDIVRIAYGRGNFNEQAISNTSLVLKCYAPMIVFVGFREILNRGFFSSQDNKVPMKNTIIGAIVNAVISIVLLKVFGIAGIAIGTTMAAFVTTILLLYGAKKMIEKETLLKLVRSIVKLILAGVFVAGLLVVFIERFCSSNLVCRFLSYTFFGTSFYILVTIFLDKENIMKYVKKLIPRFRSKRSYCRKEE